MACKLCLLLFSGDMYAFPPSSLLAFARSSTSTFSHLSTSSASSTSLLSWWPGRRGFVHLTSTALVTARPGYRRRPSLFSGAGEVKISTKSRTRVSSSTEEISYDWGHLLHSLTGYVRSSERLRITAPVRLTTARSFSTPGPNSRTSSIAEEHQQCENTPTSRTAASYSSTAEKLRASNSAANASSALASPPTSAHPPAAISGGAPVSSSACPVPATAAAPSSPNIAETAFPHFGAASAAAVATAASAAGAAPEPRAPTPTAAAAHAPRLHRLVLPPTLPQTLKESGEGKAAIAAAMERALEGKVADRHKLVLGRKLSGNDHMRLVVPKERKKRTRHTGGQNATY